MAETVYILCALTSLVCTFLLARGYQRSQSRLLMWSSMCFLFIAASNIVLVIDLIVFPAEVNLLPFRLMLNLTGLVMLIYGLIWEAA